MNPTRNTQISTHQYPPSEIKGTIIQGSIPQSIDSRGKFLEATSDPNQRHFLINGLDLRFAVSIIQNRNFQPNMMNARDPFVLIEGRFFFKVLTKSEHPQQSNLIWVSVDNFASRLHLDRDDVLEQAYTGNMNCLLGNIERLRKIVSCYFDISSSLYHLPIEKSLAPHRITYYHANAPQGPYFSSKSLLKIIKLATRVLDEDKTWCTAIADGRDSYLVSINRNKTLSIAKWCGHTEPNEKAKDYLSNGITGTAMWAFDLKQGPSILKIAREYRGGPLSLPGANVDPKRDMEHETAILSTLLEKGNITGIMDHPFAAINCESIDGNQITGFWGKYYKGGDAYDYINTPKTLDPCSPHYIRPIEQRSTFELINAIRFLWAALAYIHSQQIVNGDLKIENIFVDENPDKSLRLSIGDLGSSRKISELKPEIMKETEFVGPPCTPGYIFESDAIEIIKIARSCKESHYGQTNTFYEQQRANYLNRQAHRDVLALAISTLTLLTKQHPFMLDRSKGYSLPNTGIQDKGNSDFKHLLISTYTEPIVKALESGINPSPVKRSSAKEIAKVFQETIKTVQKYPNSELANRMRQPVNYTQFPALA